MACMLDLDMLNQAKYIFTLKKKKKLPIFKIYLNVSVFKY